MGNYQKNWFKLGIGFVVCLLVRLIPWRAPNLEPILATQMPVSRVYGALSGFLFAVFSIVLYDLFTSTLGIWTLITASTYGVLGLWAAFYFKSKKGGILDYVGFAIIGTLFFDAVTGLSIGPIFFHQSISSAFFGQIPFTAMHLLGNVSFAVLLSPVLYNFFIIKYKFSKASIINLFSPKEI